MPSEERERERNSEKEKNERVRSWWEGRTDALVMNVTDTGNHDENMKREREKEYSMKERERVENEGKK